MQNYDFIYDIGEKYIQIDQLWLRFWGGKDDRRIFERKHNFNFAQVLRLQC